jgi:hypothetical protein
MSNKLIEELNKIKELQIQCPECEKYFSVKKAGLFDINDKYSRSINGKIDLLVKRQEENFESLLKAKRD